MNATTPRPTVPQYRVCANIRYLDGALEGLLIPNGYAVTFPTRDRALSAFRWLTELSAGAFTTAAVTGNRYTVVGSPRLTEERN